MAAPGNNSLLITDEDDDDDMVIMRRQIAKISRHVLLLEEENAKRSQREVVLYPVVLGYILFRVAAWFLRRLWGGAGSCLFVWCVINFGVKCTYH